MRYLRVTLPTPTDEWATDILMQKLGDVGFDSFENDGTRLQAYIPLEAYNEESIKSVLSEAPFEELKKEVKKEEVEDKNWNEEWEKHYFDPVVVVDGELGIRAPFHQPIEGVKHEIVIEPKMAFGTGNHATTQAMLTLLSQIYLEGCSVIDMGCGSGILGIYAMMKGAKNCVSIDIDDWCIENAEENALYPELLPTVEYDAPFWRVRVGNFVEQSEAQAKMHELKKAFPSFAREMYIIRSQVRLDPQDL